MGNDKIDVRKISFFEFKFSFEGKEISSNQNAESFLIKNNITKDEFFKFISDSVSKKTLVLSNLSINEFDYKCVVVPFFKSDFCSVYLFEKTESLEQILLSVIQFPTFIIDHKGEILNSNSKFQKIGFSNTKNIFEVIDEESTNEIILDFQNFSKSIRLVTVFDNQFYLKGFFSFFLLDSTFKTNKYLVFFEDYTCNYSLYFEPNSLVFEWVNNLKVDWIAIDVVKNVVYLSRECKLKYGITNDLEESQFCLQIKNEFSHSPVGSFIFYANKNSFLLENISEFDQVKIFKISLSNEEELLDLKLKKFLLKSLNEKKLKEHSLQSPIEQNFNHIDSLLAHYFFEKSQQNFKNLKFNFYEALQNTLKIYRHKFYTHKNYLDIKNQIDFGLEYFGLDLLIQKSLGIVLEYCNNIFSESMICLYVSIKENNGNMDTIKFDFQINNYKKNISTINPSEFLTFENTFDEFINQTFPLNIEVDKKIGENNQSAMICFDIKIQRANNVQNEDFENKIIDFKHLESKNILLCVGNDFSFGFFKNVLENSKCNYSIVSNGFEILKFIKKYSSDLIIIKSDLIGFNYIDIFEIVRNEWQLEIPIIIICDESSEVQNYISNDLNIEVLKKPYTLVEFKLKTEQLLKGSILSTVISAENKNIYNLERIKYVSQGDSLFEKDIINTFYTSLSEQITTLKKKDIAKEEVKKIFHLLRGSLTILNVENILELMIDFERNFHKLDDNQYFNSVEKIITLLEKLNEQLKKDYSIV